MQQLIAENKKGCLYGKLISVFFWLVVSTPFKNISQNGSSPQVGVKHKNSLKPPPRISVFKRVSQYPASHFFTFIESRCAAPLREYALTKVGSCRKSSSAQRPKQNHAWPRLHISPQPIWIYQCNYYIMTSDLQVWGSPTGTPSQSTRQNYVCAA